MHLNNKATHASDIQLQLPYKSCRTCLTNHIVISPSAWVGRVIGSSLVEPYTYVETDVVVYARGTVAKSRIATHYSCFGTVSHL